MDLTVWTMFFLCTQFQPDRSALLEKQFDDLELPFDRVFRVDVIYYDVFCFLIIQPYIRIFCVREGAKDDYIP